MNILMNMRIRCGVWYGMPPKMLAARQGEFIVQLIDEFQF